MQRARSLKLCAVALILCIGLQATAQDGGDYEIIVGIGEAKLKSDQKNYDSKYKPPDWWVTMWAWAKAISNILYGTGKNEVSFEQQPGYFAAGKTTSKFSYGVGLGIGTKGGKFDFGLGSFRHTIYYLEIPVVARYDHVMDNGTNLFAAAGPYYAVALAGRLKTDDKKESLQFGKDDADYKRGDIGLKIMLGVKPQALPVSIGVTGDLGLRNLAPASNTIKIKNQYFGLQVGYGL
ncbi:MAG TPA: outer membrane beta-barrel protein [Chitinophagaceae bacterium]|nr:outer membrane beta-barrel protein [Chitinophagaceae bacterium]